MQCAYTHRIGTFRNNRIFVDERRRKIAGLIATHGRVSVSELAARFQVSEVTIRKDLTRLEAERGLLRVHGGAILESAESKPPWAATTSAEPAFQVRERANRAEKQAIGALAAELIADGDSIALDASTTALEVARHLRDRQELTVITNGIRIASELAGRPGITVLMPGGRLRWEAFSLVGSWGGPLLEKVNIQKAFVGAVGVTLEEGLTDASLEEAEIKRAMVQTAREVVAIVDHTKFDRVTFATFCAISQVRLLITDDQAPAGIVARIEDLGVEVRRAPRPVAERRGSIA